MCCLGKRFGVSVEHQAAGNGVASRQVRPPDERGGGGFVDFVVAQLRIDIAVRTSAWGQSEASKPAVSQPSGSSKMAKVQAPSPRDGIGDAVAGLVERCRMDNQALPAGVADGDRSACGICDLQHHASRLSAGAHDLVAQSG